jgi:SAM-dependent methyltransferase
MKLVLKQIDCPICGTPHPRQVIPSRKMNETTRKWQESQEIWVCLCGTCGLVFENPQIDIQASPRYNEDHYYNSWYNQAELHDRLQRAYSGFRLDVVEQLVDLKSTSLALDIGATGAWSHILKEKYPAIESVLLEPSRAAIDYCRETYPEVTPIHGTLEEFDGGEKQFDLITFFYSLYHITDPIGGLRKCYRMLSRGGKLVICISHVHLELEVWGSNHHTPWVDLEHFVRGAPLVFFSRRTLQEACRRAGFSESTMVVAEHSSPGEWNGRQDFYLVATKSDVVSDDIVVPTEADVLAEAGRREASWAYSNLVNFCELASKMSISAYLAKHPFPKAIVVCNDPIYSIWVHRLFADLALETEVMNEDALGKWISACSALGGGQTTIFNASWKPLTSEVLAAIGDIPVVDCIQGTHSTGDYGLHISDSDGNRVIAKAFMPYRGEEFRLYREATECRIIRQGGTMANT